MRIIMLSLTTIIISLCLADIQARAQSVTLPPRTFDPTVLNNLRDTARSLRDRADQLDKAAIDAGSTSPDHANPECGAARRDRLAA